MLLAGREGRAVVLDLHDAAVLHQHSTMIESCAAPAKLLLTIVTNLNFHLFRVCGVAHGFLVPSIAILRSGIVASQVRMNHDVETTPPTHTLGGADKRLNLNKVRRGILRDLHEIPFGSRCDHREHFVFLGGINFVVTQDDFRHDEQVQRHLSSCACVIGGGIEFGDDHAIDIAVQSGDRAIKHDALLVALRREDVEASTLEWRVIFNKRAGVLNVTHGVIRDKTVCSTSNGCSSARAGDEERSSVPLDYRFLNTSSAENRVVLFECSDMFFAILGLKGIIDHLTDPYVCLNYGWISLLAKGSQLGAVHGVAFRGRYWDANWGFDFRQDI